MSDITLAIGVNADVAVDRVSALTAALNDLTEAAGRARKALSDLTVPAGFEMELCSTELAAFDPAEYHAPVLEVLRDIRTSIASLENAVTATR